MPDRVERTPAHTVGRHRGAAFLFAPAADDDVLTPEEISPDDLAVAAVADAFLVREALPALPALEANGSDGLRPLMRRMGEAGLLGLEVPAEYGGSGLGRVAATLVTDRLAPAGGVAAAHGAHAGLATLPIVYFGTEGQRSRYLPRLASGAFIGAYALTEPGYGSDALNAHTTARPAPAGDGFVLNGEKQWITNAGIADLFVVFARLEGHGFSAFLVERESAGLTTGREYEKMGLWSSSTRPLSLVDVRVPSENLLGQPGRGHVVALGVLDIGRLNLGAAAVGSCRRLIALSARYAKERVQFGRPIARFGLVREKLARMAIEAFALEALVYRTAGLLERARERGVAEDAAGAGAEYAIECAVAKVVGSEAVGRVADEAVQIHGGNGYMRAYEVERAYRDARIQRIFEGTNEINRLTIAEMLTRRAARGQLPLAAATRALRAEVASVGPRIPFDRPLAVERWRVEGARKAALLALGLAGERLGAALADREELLGAIADLVIHLYTAESALVRAEKALPGPNGEAFADLARAAVEREIGAFRQGSARALVHLVDGAERERALGTLDRLTALRASDAVDTITLHARIAARLLDDPGEA